MTDQITLYPLTLAWVLQRSPYKKQQQQQTTDGKWKWHPVP